MTINKCINNAYWTSNNFCQLSCYKAGYGYPGDVCCNNVSPTPTKTPSSSPTLLAPTPGYDCVECDDVGTTYMIDVGSDCSTTSLLNTRCNKNQNWIDNGYCRLSCYKRGNGYDGDVCCTGIRGEIDGEFPSLSPTSTPSAFPSVSLTSTPSASPTFSPTSTPSMSPSIGTVPPPTAAPTQAPTGAPSKPPTSVPFSTTESPEAPTEASNEDGSICFSGEGEVRTKSGFRRIDQLRLGDQIKTATGNYEQIYSFGHRAPNERTEFLQLLPTKLELSPLHMVFLQSGEAVPASIIKIGDILQSGDIVTGINTVKRTGAYAPFTPSGTLVVNGVNVSNYVAFSESPTLVKIGSIKISYHAGAHAFQFFHRVYCLWDGCKSERYNQDGISKW
eukprot:CAMPEP_0178929262 /NCGR_PEP_ID=MMETSP0786-20121207/20464_1 /TAXON_ID=186022 /ORGANISM="Thalassionema frauenfeldii, Strain CCMP 1798" /LENGTH=388 /DNA_ID=CAMNT_0020605423 /DNA_START=61 /DNA_END=1224 /DNA_ORIENTATION=-